MVNSIQATSLSPAEALLGRYQTSNSEGSGSTSFGEILKVESRKEKEELEKSASSAAAAMSGVMRAPLAETPVSSGENDVNHEQGRAALQAAVGDSEPAKAAVNASQDKTASGNENFDGVLVGVQTVDAQAKTDGTLPEAQVKTEAQAKTESTLAEVLVKTEAQASDGAAAETKVQAAVTLPVEVKGVSTDQTMQMGVDGALGEGAAVPQAQQATAMEAKVQVVNVKAAADVSPTQAVTPGELAQDQVVAQSTLSETKAETVEMAKTSDTVQAEPSVTAGISGGTFKKGEPLEAAAVNAAEDGAVNVKNAGMVTTQPVSAVTASVSSEAQAQNASGKEIGASLPEKKLAAESQPEFDQVVNSQLSSTIALKTASDVKAARAESVLPATNQPLDVVKQIMRQMDVTLRGDSTSMHLQLNPKELGAIDVQMVRSAQGVSLSFVTEQASTGRLLETQINHLRQSLTESGIQLTNLNINQHSQSGGQQGGFFRQTPQFTQYVNRNLVESETKAEIASLLQTNRAGLQGVDYRI